MHFLILLYTYTFQNFMIQEFRLLLNIFLLFLKITLYIEKSWQTPKFIVFRLNILRLILVVNFKDLMFKVFQKLFIHIINIKVLLVDKYYWFVNFVKYIFKPIIIIYFVVHHINNLIYSGSYKTNKNEYAYLRGKV